VRTPAEATLERIHGAAPLPAGGPTDRVALADADETGR
jgi:hypothetical protein